MTCPTCPDRQFRSNNRAEARCGGGLVEPRRAVDAVAIEERDGGIAEIGGTIDDRFGKRRAL